jgi:hypothetical protein
MFREMSTLGYVKNLASPNFNVGAFFVLFIKYLSCNFSAFYSKLRIQKVTLSSLAKLHLPIEQVVD